MISILRGTPNEIYIKKKKIYLLLVIGNKLEQKWNWNLIFTRPMAKLKSEYRCLYGQLWNTDLWRISYPCSAKKIFKKPYVQEAAQKHWNLENEAEYKFFTGLKQTFCMWWMLPMVHSCLNYFGWLKFVTDSFCTKFSSTEKELYDLTTLSQWMCHLRR